MFKSSSLTNYAPIQNPTFTGKVTLPDGSSITKTTSSYLKQSDAVNTYATKSSVSSVENTLYDTVYNINNTYAPKENPTFTGTVTFPDNSTITNYLKSATASSTYLTQSSASNTYLSKATAEEDYLQISTALGNFLTTNTAAETYAPITNPTLFGTVTFNAEGTAITDYLKKSTAEDTYATRNNAFFSGILTFPDASVPEDYLLETVANSDYLKKTDATSTYLTQTNAASTYAPLASPTFTGTVTFPDNSTITNYLKSATASSTYLTQSNASSTYLSKETAEEDYLQISTALGNFLSMNTAAETYAPKASPTFTDTVTFVDTSTTPNTSTTITDYLKSSDASSTYLSQTDAASTYAPLVSPTFTGNIVLNGNVTLAQTKANSLTLNDNLSLCTGTNYATPNENNMLGYGITGTILTDTLVSAPNISSNTGLNFSNITLTYGVWLLYGNAGIQVTVPSGSTTGTITSAQVSIGSSGAINGNFAHTEQSTLTVRDATYISYQTMRIMSVATVSSTQYLVGKYVFSGCTLNTRQGYSSFYAYRIA